MLGSREGVFKRGTQKRRRLDGASSPTFLIAVPAEENSGGEGAEWSIVGFAQFQHCERLDPPTTAEIAIIESMAAMKRKGPETFKYALPLGVVVASSGWFEEAIRVVLPRWKYVNDVPASIRTAVAQSHLVGADDNVATVLGARPMKVLKYKHCAKVPCMH